MRENRATGTAILIGSARANMLAELFLADCFFSEPYRREESRVPFWLQFLDGTWPPSCCGGPQPPRGADDCGPGIYWREGGAWEHLRAEPLKVGVGACVIRRDAWLGRLELAVFGLSAIATAGMGRLLCECSENFWPPVGSGAGLQYGVVLCQFDLEGCESGEESIDEIRIARPQFIRLRYRVPRRRDPPRRQ